MTQRSSRRSLLWLFPATLILVGCPQESPPASPAQAPSQPAAVESSQSSTPKPRTPIGVAEFMRTADPGVPGPHLLQGVVSAISGEEGTIALTDAPGGDPSCDDCSTSCAPLQLPVRWRGPMPAVHEKVRIEGNVERAGDKLIFVADRVERPGSEP